MNADLIQFFSRIQTASQHLPAEILKPFINEDDLKAVYTYFNVFDTPAQLNGYENLLDQMPFNSNVRFDKKVTGLPRTVNVLRINSGEYVLQLETKSKDHEGKKTQLFPRLKGSSKRGKRSWRLDQTPQAPFVHFVIPLPTQIKFQYLKEEIGVTKLLNHAMVSQLHPGSTRMKDSGCVVDVYSEEAGGGSLHSFLQSSRYQDSAPSWKLSFTQEAMKQLMVGLNQIHAQGFIHQDIKPDNILVELSESGECKLKYADFGLVARIGPTKNYLRAMTTAGYESPEIIYSYRAYPTTGLVTYADTLGVSDCTIYYPERLKQRLGRVASTAFCAPNPINDIWSLGVVFYQLLTNNVSWKIPRTPLMKKHALLRAMLAPVRETRLSGAHCQLILDILVANQVLISHEHPHHKAIAKFIKTYQDCLEAEWRFHLDHLECADFNFIQASLWNDLNEIAHNFEVLTSKQVLVSQLLSDIKARIRRLNNNGVVKRAAMLRSEFDDLQAEQATIMTQRQQLKWLARIKEVTLSQEEVALLENQDSSMNNNDPFIVDYFSILEKENRTNEDIHYLKIYHPIMNFIMKGCKASIDNMRELLKPLSTRLDARVDYLSTNFPTLIFLYSTEQNKVTELTEKLSKDLNLSADSSSQFSP